MGFAERLYHRPPTGRRADPRLRLALPAELITLDGQGPAIIENLSRSGARIATRLALKVGDGCVLRWRGGEVFALVRWSEQQRCGLIFDSRLSQDDLMQARWLEGQLGRLEREQWLAWAREFVNGRA